MKECFQEYDVRLKKLLTEMREKLDTGALPAIRKGQKCNGCSLKELCMPSMKRIKSLRSELKELEQEQED